MTLDTIAGSRGESGNLMTGEPHFLVFDVETTGIDTFNDRIVQLVIATADRDGNLLAHREWIIDPGVEVPQGAAEVHGLTTEYLTLNGQDPRTALDEAFEMFWAYKHLIWVAYNLNFDASILASEFVRYDEFLDPGDYPDPQESQLFDPLVVDRAKDKYRKGKRKLLNVAEHYGIPLDESKLHNALYDVEITAKVAAAVEKKYGVPSNEEQAEMYRAWAVNIQEYFRRTDPEAVVDPDWPLKLKEEA